MKLNIDLFLLKRSLKCAPCIKGTGGIPAGCQFDKDGNLFVADMKLGILKVRQDGSYEQVVHAKKKKNNPTIACMINYSYYEYSCSDDFIEIQVATLDADGNGLQGCNDCIFDSVGNLWVTAPASEIHVLPHRRSEVNIKWKLLCRSICL